jgi:hypothetical protein
MQPSALNDGAHNGPVYVGGCRWLTTREDSHQNPVYTDPLHPMHLDHYEVGRLFLHKQTLIIIRCNNSGRAAAIQSVEPWATMHLVYSDKQQQPSLVNPYHEDNGAYLGN